jgi:hypothetical protein
MNRAVESEDLRGDVLEREISHFYWQTTKDSGNVQVPGFLTARMTGLGGDVKDFFLRLFSARTLELS